MVKKAKQQKNITLEAVSDEKKGEGWGHFFRHLGHDVKKVGKRIARSKPVKTLAKDVVPAAIGIAVGAETENPYAGLAAQEAAQQGVNKAYSGKGSESTGKCWYQLGRRTFSESSRGESGMPVRYGIYGIMVRQAWHDLVDCR